MTPPLWLDVNTLTKLLKELGVRRINMMPTDQRFGKILSREAFAELLAERLATQPGAVREPQKYQMLDQLFSVMLKAYHEAQDGGCDQNGAYDCLVEAGSDFIKQAEHGAGDAGAPQEQCHYCGEWYPKPVSYHHDAEECAANLAGSPPWPNAAHLGVLVRALEPFVEREAMDQYLRAEYEAALSTLKMSAPQPPTGSTGPA